MHVAVCSTMFVLLGAALAGCLGSEPADDAAATDPAAGPAEIPTTLEFSKCRQFGIDFWADPAVVLPLLPPGFETAGLFGEATNATIFAYHPTCKATLDGTSVGEIDELWLFAGIRPPATGADPEADVHAYHLGILTSSPETAAAYRAWGIPRVHMETASSQATGPAGAGPFTMVADVADISLEIEGTLAPTLETELPGQHNRFVMADPNGTITGALDVVFGAYQVPAGGTGEASLMVDGESVETRAYPGAACICGNGEWTWTMEYTPLTDLEGGEVA